MFEVFRKDLIVIRVGDGFLDERGIWLDGTDTYLTIKASVQPTPAKVLETLPEGYRTKSTYTLYTNTRLRVSEDGLSNPDNVLIEDQLYQAIRIASWQNKLINHYQILVSKVDVDGN